MEHPGGSAQKPAHNLVGELYGMLPNYKFNIKRRRANFQRFPAASDLAGD
jgi:hypothetical protein